MKIVRGIVDISASSKAEMLAFQLHASFFLAFVVSCSFFFFVSFVQVDSLPLSLEHLLLLAVATARYVGKSVGGSSKSEHSPP